MQGDFSIGDWRVQPQINLIHRGQVSVHLEPKVMQVLVALASNPGELVTKQCLLQTVWPGVFVGDDVLTRAISEIRRVFSDDARSPRIIQTIPKTGYRLIAPVTFEAPPVESAGGAVVLLATAVGQLSAESLLVAGESSDRAGLALRPPNRSRRPLLLSLVGVSFLAVIGVVAVGHLWSRQPDRTWMSHYRTVPFTTYPGSEGQAAFSPDGNEIAFVWNGDKGGNKQIYVKILGTATPLRLTSDSADSVDPSWSPDGRFIAFIRLADTGNAIYIVPALGGPERRIHTLLDPTSWDYAGVAWTADGKHLIFPDRVPQEEPSSLFTISLDTLQTRRLTSPPFSWDGDWTPAVSPDGRLVAFVRGPESAVRNVYVMSSDGGAPRRLTTDGRLILGVAWTADSRNVVFSSNRDGSFSLWQVPASGGALTHLAAGGDNAYSPAISRRGNLLAYAHGTGKWNIVRLDLRNAAAAGAGEILSSNQQDSSPQFSPDGTRIAFQSWRSGAQEVWICNADGSDPVQLTFFAGALTGSPRWSPDGKLIAFDSRPEGRAHIYVISPDGGSPRALTSGQSNDIVPSWSPDGKWVYFGTNRSGSWQIWTVPVNGGAAHQVTSQGGMIALPSPDGRWVYYTRNAQAGLWRIPASGGPEQQVLQGPSNGFQGYWGLTQQGIYFLDTSNPPGAILFADFSSLNRSSLVHKLAAEPTPLAGLSISPDGRWLAYATTEEASSNITLVERVH